VRYIRGLSDSICSHQTIPMLSSVVALYAVQTCTSLRKTAESDTENFDENDDPSGPVEDLPMTIRRDESSNIVETHQVDDYMYRSFALENVAFYNFVRCFKKVVKAKDEA